MAGLSHGDHGRRLKLGLEDVNADGRVLDGAECVSDQPADAVVIEPDADHSLFAASNLRRWRARPRVRRPRTCIAVK